MLLNKDYYIVIRGELDKVVAYTVINTTFKNQLIIKTSTGVLRNTYIDTFEEIHKYIKIKEEWYKEYPELLI